ncbi:hypothetical protein BGZ58_002997 [Dissophora ornata]|nr:hypothetical protein BGZ58_002997 [Dissophora ornata]
MASASEIPRQAFRAYSPSNRTPVSEIINVDTRFDSKTKRYIILWKDIERVFKGVQYVANESNAVSFMTDDDFKELSPSRICYHPGIVLRIILENSDHESSALASAPTSAEADTWASYPTTTFGGLGDVQATPSQTYSLSVAEIEPTVRTIVVSSNGMNPKARISLHACNELYGSYFQAVMAGQIQQADIIKDNMNKHFGDLKVEMDRNKVLQEQILGMQEKMQTMQQEALDRLALIQSRVQAIVIQTYELHEYPIPRLFIVLPKALRNRDRVSKPFSNQFRLFFLCECGNHTTSGGGEQHEIHLAKHEGYDVDKPNDFFKKYGPYVLTMMQMIKYGIIAAGMIVPPLAHFKLVKGIDTIQKNLKLAEHDIVKLVDETIDYIKDQKSSANGGIDVVEDQMGLDKLEGQAGFDKLEVIEGADFRQLQSYLTIQDKGRVLGNLYRIVTSEGHVKWVCMDHYRENYRESANKALKETIEANRGKFDEFSGVVVVTAASRTAAKQIYEAIIKARGVQQLEITVNWDATLDDFRVLNTAITKTNIVSLTIQGGGTSPASDLFNRARRYEPLVQLMSNGRIQSLSLFALEDFFNRLGTNFALASKLKVLKIDAEVSPQRGRSALQRIIDKCPSLVDLDLRSQFVNQTFEEVMSNANRPRNLKSLKLRSTEGDMDIEFHQGDVQAMEADISFWHFSNDEYWVLLKKGYLTRLKATTAPPSESSLGRLDEILRLSPKLAEIEMMNTDASALAIIYEVDSLRDEGFLPGMRKLRLHGGGSDRVVVKYSDSYTISINGEMEETYNSSYEAFVDLYREHGWCIDILDTKLVFLDGFAESLDESTTKSGSKLKSLTLCPNSLSSTGLECVDRVIERSWMLESLRLCFFNMSHKKEQEGLQAKFESLLGRYNPLLQGLTLSDCSMDAWFPRLARCCSSRRVLQALRTFSLSLNEKSEVEDDCLHWIAGVVSAPPSTTSNSSDEWMPLKSIHLKNLSLREDQWETLIKAIGFSGLEQLQLESTNFSSAQFEVLLECIPEDHDVEVFLPENESIGISECEELRAGLLAKAPLVHVRV